jgi:hypothetical protein
MPATRTIVKIDMKNAHNAVSRAAVGGPETHVRPYLDRLVKAAETLGLQINLSKCEVIGGFGLLPGIPKVRGAACWDLLGVPFGSGTESAAAFAPRVAERAERRCRPLACVGRADAVVGPALLRHYAGFALETTPPAAGC